MSHGPLIHYKLLVGKIALPFERFSILEATISRAHTFSSSIRPHTVPSINGEAATISQAQADGNRERRHGTCIDQSHTMFHFHSKQPACLDVEGV
jgi:hypothetical protein